MNISMVNYQELSELVAQSGCESDEQFFDWFKGMSETEIKNEADQCWPGDDNSDFASRAHYIVSRLSINND